MEDSNNNSSQNIPSHKQETKTDEAKLEKVKDIVNLLARTVSLIKIYPPHHSSVKNFTDELLEKLTSFLDKRWKLELDIEEFSFIYQGKIVYHDESAIKSLPFLFFKDGMQKLFFYKGLKKDQFDEFLELIKKYYESPPGESDMVSLLWEKDFANIRYFAPDDFLETKIGIGKKPIEFKIDRKEFQTGLIELTLEDKKELSEASLASRNLEKGPAMKRLIEEKTEIESSDQVEKFSSLTEKENRSLKFMLDTNRKISPEEDLMLLILEMLHLEEDNEQFSGILHVMRDSFQDILDKGNFYLANQVLKQILELRQLFLSRSRQKVSLIDRFLNDIKNRKSLDLVKEALLKGNITDFDPLFDYLRLLGPQIIPFVAELFGKLESSDFRQKALEFFKEIGKKNFSFLMDIVDEERPSLTKEVIAILSSIKEKKTVQFLANFIPYRNKSIKQAAIKSLGKIEDLIATKILIGFLADEEENLRILAAQNLLYFPNSSVLKPVFNIIQKKDFKKKNRKEKIALLSILARSGSQDAWRILEEILKKPSFLSFPKQIENSLCAIKVLENAGTVEAIKILKKGAQVHHKKIRKATRFALEKLLIENPSNSLS